ncbi:MAG: hypothetical protein M1830_006941 [Pleopsidium flavum]|nr:MAG: hypothetical protein M1830_006941 [Pleopsidium flavum]
MSVLVYKAGRIALRRSVQRQQQSISPVTKRHKSSSSPEQPAQPSNPPTEDLSTTKAIPTSDTIALLPPWQRLGPLSKAFNAYGRSQRKRPYVTQLCSSLVIYLCGDVCAQNIGGDDYNPWRTVRNITIGGISSIPSYKWFIFLGQTFNYSSKTLSLTTKVLVNQIAFSPLFNSYFFGMQALLSGDRFAEAWEHIKRTVPISLINSCKLWPAVTAFSFTFIQAQYRALFAGIIAIGWQSYLSYLNQKAADEEGDEKSHHSSMNGAILPPQVRPASSRAQA